MKKTILSIGSLLILAFVTSSYIKKWPTYTGYTGGVGQGTCANCHYSSLAEMDSLNTLSLTSYPVFIGNKYIAGQTYTINIHRKSKSYTNYVVGFDCEILNNSSSSAINAGIINGISGVSFTCANGAKTDAIAGDCSGSTSGNVISVNNNNLATVHSFKWIAPLSGKANIYYSCLAGGYGFGVTLNDSLLLTKQISTDIEVLKNGVVGCSLSPNPSSDYLKIDYTLLSPTNIKVVLLDMQGKEVSVIIDEYQENGIHSKTHFYSKKIDAGVYLLKLYANNISCFDKKIIRQ